jgi:RNA polymerase sigma factor (sigma-70 family)
MRKNDPAAAAEFNEIVSEEIDKITRPKLKKNPCLRLQDPADVRLSIWRRMLELGSAVVRLHNPLAYIRRMTKNRLIDAVRHDYGVGKEPGATPKVVGSSKAPEQVLAPEPGPVENAVTNDLLNEVRKHFTDEEYELLWLRYAEDRSCEEIGLIKKTTKEAIRKRIKRALDKVSPLVRARLLGEVDADESS